MKEENNNIKDEQYHDDFPEDEDFPEDDDFLEDHDKFFDEEQMQPLEEKPAPKPVEETSPKPPPPQQQKKEEDPPPPQPLPKEENIPEEKQLETAPQTREKASLKDLSMLLDVEIARLSMPMNELMNLQSGNVIDLKITPENPVDLVANGQIIGKGELLNLGDTIGVRILEIG